MGETWFPPRTVAEGERSSCIRQLGGEPVGKSLAHVRRFDRVRACEGSNRPRNAGDTDASSTRERKPIDRIREELRGCLRAARERVPQMRPRLDDSLADDIRRFA